MNRELNIRCDKHGVRLIYEAGGSLMPTLYGRTYCPSCQDELFDALDAQGPRPVPPTAS